MNYDLIEILVVEDNCNDAELTMDALANFNTENKVLLAENGELALDYLYCNGIYNEKKFTTIPKLIILDLNLPRVDGFEVLQKVKSDPNLKIIPVVVFSSSGKKSDILKCYQLGANSYVVKPFDGQEYISKVSSFGSYWLKLNEQPKFE